ncbi:MAG: hypothetical protein JO038_07485 [Alphaproteobacteria bacterium]|nr:hypothetical protein [Alphaproteobacteria bacterium]
MNAAAASAGLSLGRKFVSLSAEQRVRAFLDGETQGEDVLHEIFDHVLDEPIPESMRALLRK